MNTQSELDKIIENTNGTRLIGRPLVVRVAEEKLSSNRSSKLNNMSNLDHMNSWYPGSGRKAGSIEQYPYLTDDI